MAAPVSEPEDAITGINVIPLVDIVLVLLIVFMMTASFIVAPAVNVELPQVSQADEPPPRSLHFVVDPTGAIFLDGQPVEAAAVLSIVEREVAANADVQVLVSADRQVAYGEVVTLLDVVRSGGVRKFAISVETVAKK